MNSECKVDLPFPIKVVAYITPTFAPSMGITLGAVLFQRHEVDYSAFGDCFGKNCFSHLERLVSITDIFEEVDLFLLGEQGSTDGVHGGISLYGTSILVRYCNKAYHKV